MEELREVARQAHTFVGNLATSEKQTLEQKARETIYVNSKKILNIEADLAVVVLEAVRMTRCR